MAEYAKFGEGWVKRSKPDAEWKECPVEEVPTEAIAERAMVAERRRLGRDPYFQNPGPVLLPNPALEAQALELGITPAELRRAFSEGLTPGEARARYNRER